MPTTIRALLLLPFLIFAPTLMRGAYTSTEELTGDISASASVVVENVNGKIVLLSGESDRYHIAITKKSRTQKNLELMEVRHEIDDDRLELKVHIPKKKGWFSMGQIQGSVEIVITAPATADLTNIRTINGSVDITGFSNGIHASSVNGVIRAHGLRGSTYLETVNGSIRASFIELGADDHLSFSSVNGGINLELPPHLNADLRTSVVNGRIHCDFPLTLTDGASSRKLRGRIGEGGAELKASTVNGSIRLSESS